MNWIIVTIIAAFFQNLRSSFQKKINKDVSTIASTYVRFSFALPLSLLLFFVYFREFAIIKDMLVQPGFLINVTLASIFQVIFTFVLLYLFKFSNFDSSDVIYGNRFNKKLKYKMPLFRKLGSTFFKYLLKIFSINVSDPTNGSFATLNANAENGALSSNFISTSSSEPTFVPLIEPISTGLGR